MSAKPAPTPFPTSQSAFPADRSFVPQSSAVRSGLRDLTDSRPRRLEGRLEVGNAKERRLDSGSQDNKPGTWVTVTEMIQDVGGGWLDGNTLDGPFRYMKDNEYKAPVEGTGCKISFWTEDDQYIWDMKCGFVRNVASEGWALCFEKV